MSMFAHEICLPTQTGSFEQQNILLKVGIESKPYDVSKYFDTIILFEDSSHRTEIAFQMNEAYVI